MRLTHEVRVPRNPFPIVFPRFTVSQIMRHEQTVSFRIFFTANYYTFSDTDGIVVKYAQLDEEGNPKLNDQGEVLYQKVPDNLVPVDLPYGTAAVFGKLEIEDGSRYSVRWETPASEPSSMLPNSPLHTPMPVAVPQPETAPIAAIPAPMLRRQIASLDDQRSHAKLNRDCDQERLNGYIASQPETPSATDPTKTSAATPVKTLPNGKTTKVTKSVKRTKTTPQVVPESFPVPMAITTQEPIFIATEAGEGALEAGVTHEIDSVRAPEPVVVEPPEAPEAPEEPEAPDEEAAPQRPLPPWNASYLKRADERYVRSIFRPTGNGVGDELFITSIDGVEHVITPTRWRQVFEPQEDSELLNDDGDPLQYFTDQETLSDIYFVTEKEPGAVYRPPYDFTPPEETPLVDSPALPPPSPPPPPNPPPPTPTTPPEPTPPPTPAPAEEKKPPAPQFVQGEEPPLPTYLPPWREKDLATEESRERAAREQFARYGYIQGVRSKYYIITTIDGEEYLVADSFARMRFAGMTEAQRTRFKPFNKTVRYELSYPAFFQAAQTRSSPLAHQTAPVLARKKDPIVPVTDILGSHSQIRPFRNHIAVGYEVETGDLLWKVCYGLYGSFDRFDDYVSFLLKCVTDRVKEDIAIATGGKSTDLSANDIIDVLAMIAQKRLFFRRDPGYVFCHWKYSSTRLQRLLQSPDIFRNHHGRHLYWYLICGTANSTELRDDTYRILIGKQTFVERAREYVVQSPHLVTIPGNSFFNPMMIEVRDERDVLYDLQVPYIVEWTFQPRFTE